MSRNYQRKERDWRRPQPAFQEEDRWSASRSDDDFSMGLGQESRGSHREDERFQNSRPRQRSEDRDSEGEYPGTAWKSWNERFEGIGVRGWYEGVEDAMHRGEGQFTGRGPRNYKRSDDRIEEDINEHLTRHGRIDATDIEVSVENGEVTLRGSVDNRQAKRLAEDIAYAISGVKEVANQIKVKQRGESDSGDKGENTQDTDATGRQQRKIG